MIAKTLSLLLDQLPYAWSVSSTSAFWVADARSGIDDPADLAAPGRRPAVLLAAFGLSYLAPAGLLPLLILVFPLIGGVLLLLALAGNRHHRSGRQRAAPPVPAAARRAQLSPCSSWRGCWVCGSRIFVLRRGSETVSSPTYRPLLVFNGVVVLAFGIGQLPWYPFAQHAALDAQIGGLSVFLLAAGAFLLVAHKIGSLQWLERLTWFYIVVGAFSSLVGLCRAWAR